VRVEAKINQLLDDRKNNRSGAIFRALLATFDRLEIGYITRYTAVSACCHRASSSGSRQADIVARVAAPMLQWYWEDFMAIDDKTRIELEAVVFRRLVDHLRSRTDVQNIDMMDLTGFCRNCLASWMMAEANAMGLAMTRDACREAVYGMPYAEWKAICFIVIWMTARDVRRSVGRFVERSLTLHRTNTSREKRFNSPPKAAFCARCNYGFERYRAGSDQASCDRSAAVAAGR
jgi:hypothetical protein